MTKKEYLVYHKNFCARMVDITQKKNADYTGNAKDPFHNFTRVTALGICTTEQGFLTRMTDKLCRISSFVQKGTLLVKDESVQDTLHDLSNYCALMSAFIESEKTKTKTAPKKGPKHDRRKKSKRKTTLKLNPSRNVKRR